MARQNPTPDELLWHRFSTDPTTLALSTASARVQLTPGYLYEARCYTATCYFKLGGASVEATTSSNRLEPTEKYVFYVGGAGENDYIAAILAAGTATLEIKRRSP